VEGTTTEKEHKPRGIMKIPKRIVKEISQKFELPSKVSFWFFGFLVLYLDLVFGFWFFVFLFLVFLFFGFLGFGFWVFWVLGSGF